jgi:hypothetical protein
MKRKIFMAAAALLATASQAQETYQSAQLADNDLNGTARYIGMGGAMEALGADISTIGSNPAGIAMFRKSSVNTSFGLVAQEGAKKFDGAKSTNMSFDQAGFVYSMHSGRNSFVNVAFNYHKSKNFDQILSAAGSLSGASQNKLSYLKGAEGVYDAVRYGHADNNGYFTESTVGSGNGAWLGVNQYGNNYYESMAYSQLDYLYYNTLLVDNSDASVYYNDANAYGMNRYSNGYIGEYDFNISANISDRFYIGITCGLHDVHYNDRSVYSEQLVDANGNISGTVAVSDDRRITGNGVDAKLGIIVRPVATSPFRVGLYVHTPTWYSLTTSNYTRLSYAPTANAGGTTTEYAAQGSINESYDFKLYTPWKFGLSLGHTVGNYLALGATYEWADYSTLDNRINDGGYYDDWGSYYETSSSDKAMKSNTKASLRGVSTLKLGAEFKPAPEWSVRLGYNYVSPMYKKDGFKDGTVESYGTYYSSTTDYTNWKATNRFTVGAGYAHKGFSIDLAYQYSQTNGDFYPFMNYYAGTNEDQSLNNIAQSSEVKYKRNQLVLTLGYKF